MELRAWVHFSIEDIIELSILIFLASLVLSLPLLNQHFLTFPQNTNSQKTKTDSKQSIPLTLIEYRASPNATIEVETKVRSKVTKKNTPKEVKPNSKSTHQTKKSVALEIIHSHKKQEDITHKQKDKKSTVSTGSYGLIQEILKKTEQEYSANTQTLPKNSNQQSNIFDAQLQEQVDAIHKKNVRNVNSRSGFNADNEMTDIHNNKYIKADNGCTFRRANSAFKNGGEQWYLVGCEDKDTIDFKYPP